MHKAIKTVLIMALAVSAANSLRAQTLTGVDVGIPSQPGSTTFAGGKYTVVGGGSDIWGTADNFHYAYMPITGDFDYVMQVESLVGNSGDGGWSKVELMAKRSSPTGDPGSEWNGDPFLANMMNRPASDTANSAPAGVNNRGPQWRCHRAGDVDPVDPFITYEGQATWTSPNPAYPPVPPNVWLRLERVGSTFWMATSDTGAANSWNYYTPHAAQGYNTAGSWPAGVDNPGASGLDSTFTEAWPNQILLGIAVTAHNDADISTAVVNGFGPYTNKVPIQITTQPPATIAASANSTLTIAAAATGDPVHYQWLKDGNPIPATQANPGSLSQTYVKQLVQVADSGSYVLRCFGAGQTAVDSTPCVVTITVDTTSPSITEAKPLGSQTSLQVTFSEPVTSATATVPGNYQFTGGVTATAAVLSADGYSVTLTTTLQALNTQYTLTVTGVQDTAIPANTIAAPGNTATFTSVMLLTGYAFYERWMDASGDLGDINAFATAIADGTARAPDFTQLVNQLGCPWGAADNYNARVRTYFTPPSAGNYVFFVAADDNARVFLSTDDNPLNKKLICQEASWSNQYNWNIDSSLEQSSLTFDTSEWPSGPWTYITLAANTKYLIEGLLNEGGGGDGLDITFIKEGDANPPQDATGMHMLGSVISWYESPDVLPPSITAPTAAYNMTLAPGATGTISVTANNPAAGALTYQWMRNGYDIPGATSADYVIASASVTDMGQYRCKVTNKNATLTCQPCVVLVTGTGVFAIEGEDFDYNSGQSMPAASVMPYYGGAYAGLSAVLGVDYQNDDDPGNNMADGLPVYRYGGDLGSTADDPNTGATCSVEQPSGQFAITRAGEWTMTNNFKLGWVGTGNWGNYTRTFPSPAKPYHVAAAGSGDTLNLGQLNYRLGKVTAGVGTATQTVEPIGVFYGEGTGAWSRNALIVMTETAGGAAKTVELGGTVTLRWSYDSGDSEYLLFYPATAGPTISVGTNAQGQPVLTFTGTLLGASAVTGPYAAVAGATSPFTVTGGAGTMQFYRSSQ